MRILTLVTCQLLRHSPCTLAVYAEGEAFISVQEVYATPFPEELPPGPPHPSRTPHGQVGRLLSHQGGARTSRKLIKPGERSTAPSADETTERAVSQYRNVMICHRACRCVARLVLSRIPPMVELSPALTRPSAGLHMAARLLPRRAGHWACRRLEVVSRACPLCCPDSNQTPAHTTAW